MPKSLGEVFSDFAWWVFGLVLDTCSFFSDLATDTLNLFPECPSCRRRGIPATEGGYLGLKKEVFCRHCGYPFQKDRQGLLRAWVVKKITRIHYVLFGLAAWSFIKVFGTAILARKRPWEENIR